MEATMSSATSAQTSPSSTSISGVAMSLQATMAASVRVAATSSPTAQEFSAKNRFEEEEKEEEGGEENMEGFVRKSKGFLPMNLSNPKGESFEAKGIAGLKEKLASGFSRDVTLGFFNLSNRARVLARSSHW